MSTSIIVTIKITIMGVIIAFREHQASALQALCHDPS
jgi:hypothetical protein